MGSIPRTAKEQQQQHNPEMKAAGWEAEANSWNFLTRWRW
jgi:hypothetical protein